MLLLPSPVVVQQLPHGRAGDGGGGDDGGGELQEMKLLKIFARLRRADDFRRLRRARGGPPEVPHVLVQGDFFHFS